MRRQAAQPGSARGPYTLVAFHAHPDDEALLTGGTLAKAAAEGHRVVLVTATDGERGLAGADDDAGPQLAAVRIAELRASAAALGCARVVQLGYGDSGLHPDPSDGRAFTHVDVETAADRLAAVLREERADVLTTYDHNGGYGHPDHVQVHRVGGRAAELAGTPVVLEATVSAPLLRGILALLRLVGDQLGWSTPLGTDRIFSAHREVTHRIRVHRHLPAKRAALAAHATQGRAEGQVRLLARLLRLPRPLFALALGTEWYVEPGRAAGPRSPDVFASVPLRRRHELDLSTRWSPRATSAISATAARSNRSAGTRPTAAGRRQLRRQRVPLWTLVGVLRLLPCWSSPSRFPGSPDTV